jgi:hypothetical protein
VGNHRTNVPAWGDSGPEWRPVYRCDFGEVVGRRVRRLREREGLFLREVDVRKPGGGLYSVGFLSRLERGWVSPPLWVYIKLAERFAVEPGELLGPELTDPAAHAGERTLLAVIRRLGLTPEDVIERLARG